MPVQRSLEPPLQSTRHPSENGIRLRQQTLLMTFRSAKRGGAPMPAPLQIMEKHKLETHLASEAPQGAPTRQELRGGDLMGEPPRKSKHRMLPQSVGGAGPPEQPKSHHKINLLEEFRLAAPHTRARSRLAAGRRGLPGGIPGRTAPQSRMPAPAMGLTRAHKRVSKPLGESLRKEGDGAESNRPGTAE